MCVGVCGPLCVSVCVCVCVRACLVAQTFPGIAWMSGFKSRVRAEGRARGVRGTGAHAEHGVYIYIYI